MSIFSRNKIIQIPIPKVRWRLYGETNRTAVAIVAWSTLAFVVVAVVIGALLFKLVMKIDTPPPKVITKTVYRDALTAAQQDFIQQCESDKKDINPSDSSQPLMHGIPNIESQPWTCTFGQ